MGRTADEFKGQGGCGVAATDVVGVAYDYTSTTSASAKGFDKSMSVGSKGSDIGSVSKPHWGHSRRNGGSLFTISHTVSLQLQNSDAFEAPPQVRQRGTSSRSPQ
jgi:hypothetical protein